MSKILVTHFLDNLSSKVHLKSFGSPYRKSDKKEQKKKKVEWQLQSFLT